MSVRLGRNKEFSKNRFAQVLREQRGELSLRDAANEIGVAHATLSRLEQGHTPSLDVFLRVFQWLPGVSPQEMMKIAYKSFVEQ